MQCLLTHPVYRYSIQLAVYLEAYGRAAELMKASQEPMGPRTRFEGQRKDLL